ncbi:hypothetical protein QAD02_010451 [Eretmocerus hayati]|uniref:Uncharacterized protein n=1 Tax=Eretmocerus hayati TaxID=131215 RepID=A0ACC2NTT3_9HYME|nr:hypothetical protein QAD02_010451 [Eretmocerus hayati]
MPVDRAGLSFYPSSRSWRGARGAHVIDELTQDDPNVAENQAPSNRMLGSCTDSLSQVSLNGGEECTASRTSERCRESTLPPNPGALPREPLEAESTDQNCLAFSPRTSELKGAAREQNRKERAYKVKQSTAAECPKVPATTVDRDYQIPLSPGSV